MLRNNLKNVLTATTITLAGCGGGGDNSLSNVGTTPVNTGTPTIPVNPGVPNTPVTPPSVEKMFGKVQIDENNIGNGTYVNIYSNGILLYSVTTDENGIFVVETQKLLQALSSNNISVDTTLEIKAVGGKIIGELKTYNTIDEINNLVISPVSNIVSKIIDGNISLKDGQGKLNTNNIKYSIGETAKNILTNDLNGDGEINKKDLDVYDISKHDSDLENQLRNNGYLSSFYSGVSVSVDNIINSITSINNTINPTQQGNKLYLNGGSGKSYKSYSYDGNVWYNYNDAGIDLTGNEGKIYYKETDYYNNNSIVKQFIITPIDNGTDNGNDDYISDIPNIPTIGEIKLNYTPINSIGVDITEEIKKLNDKKALIQSEIDKINIEISNLKTTDNTLYNQLQEKLNSLNSNYNSLNSLGKTLVDPNVSYDTKKSLIDGQYSLNNIQRASMQREKALNVSIMPSNLDTQTSLSLLENKRNALIAELAVKKTQLDNKKISYEQAYALYLLKDREYKEDQANYIKYLNLYNQSVSDFNNLLNTIKSFGTIPYAEISLSGVNSDKIDWYINRLKNEELDSSVPKSSTYSQDNTSKSKAGTYQNNYAYLEMFGFKYVLDVEYGYSGNNKNYPAKIFVTNINTGNTESVQGMKSSAHLSAVVNYLLSVIGLRTASIKLQELKALKEKKEEYFASGLEYGLDTVASKDMYKDQETTYLNELSAYSQAQNSYNNIDAELSKTIKAIQTLKDLISSKTSIENQKTNVGTQLNTYNSTLVSKTNSLSDLQNELLKLQNGGQNNFYQEKVREIVKQYIPSKSFVLDETSGVFYEGYTVEYNYEDYSNYPINTYVKFGSQERNGELKMFPAQVSIEYKINPNDNLTYTTEVLEASNEEQIREIRSFLQYKAQIFINLRKIDKDNYLGTQLFSEALKGNNIAKAEFLKGLNIDGIKKYQNIASNMSLRQTPLSAKVQLEKKMAVNSVSDFAKSYANGTIDGGKQYLKDATDFNQMIEDTKQMIKGTGESLKNTYERSTALVAVGIAHAVYAIKKDEISKEALRGVESIIEAEDQEVQQAIAEFKDGITHLYDSAKYISENLQYIENGEYWGGYIEGYVSGLVGQGTLMSSVAKSGKVGLNKIIKSNSYLKLTKIFDRMKVIIDMGKTHGYKGDFSKMEATFDKLDKVCPIKTPTSRLQPLKVSSCLLSGLDQSKVIMGLLKSSGYSDEMQRMFFESIAYFKDDDKLKDFLLSPAKRIEDFQKSFKSLMSLYNLKMVLKPFKLPPGLSYRTTEYIDVDGKLKIGQASKGNFGRVLDVTDPVMRQKLKVIRDNNDWSEGEKFVREMFGAIKGTEKFDNFSTRILDGVFTKDGVNYFLEVKTYKNKVSAGYQNMSEVIRDAEIGYTDNNRPVRFIIGGGEDLDPKMLKALGERGIEFFILKL